MIDVDAHYALCRSSPGGKHYYKYLHYDTTTPSFVCRYCFCVRAVRHVLLPIRGASPSYPWAANGMPMCCSSAARGVAHGLPMGCPWAIRGTAHGQLSVGCPQYAYRLPTGCPRAAHGLTTGYPRDARGPSVGSTWAARELPVGCPWEAHVVNMFKSNNVDLREYRSSSRLLRIVIVLSFVRR